MNYRWQSSIGLVLAVLLSNPLDLPGQEKEQAEMDRAAVDRIFTLRVLPVLKRKCFGCHADKPDELKGDLDLRTREGLLKGGESEEPAIVPGKPELSLLYKAVLWEDLEMPPKENDRLTKQEIRYIHDWITGGAPWPSVEVQQQVLKRERSIHQNEDGLLVSTSGGLSDDWTYRRYQAENLWAFQPLAAPPAPTGAANPIDAFVRAKQRQANIVPAPQADKLTLIRRATYDLTGLPPKPQHVREFLADESPQAWSELIDRLLASPHYGERWGQHWLDVVRYADTAGFSNDYERSNFWRYRDYVIRAFNEDKPYDQFVIEQIAGDELDPGNAENLIATSFLRAGPWGTAMIPQPIARQLYLDDLVNNVGEVFLSTALRCAKCHDHKFDPIPTQDYYRLYAAFAATQPAERPAAFRPQENLLAFVEEKQHVEKMLAFATEKKDQLITKREAAARKWYEEKELPYKNVQQRRGDPDEMKPPRHVGLDYVDQGRLKVREQDEWIWQRRLERFQPLVQGVYNGPDYKYNGRKLRIQAKLDQQWRPDSRILNGGSLEAPGEPVSPGVLSATGLPIPGAAEGDRFALPTSLSGRRLALARWIADPANPLTTRSIVNRIWLYHFGQGIAGNPNNFGSTGKKPTHVLLLDWLAADFVEHGWKFKRMHRLIMLSETYQQSSQHPNREQLDATDPDNTLLASFQPRRLTAEELRDSMLLVSGELTQRVGGLPAMAEINMEVALQPRMIQFSIAPAHQPARTPWLRNRRSVYTYRVRGQADPFLEVFNQPDPNTSCEVRNAPSVTPQAFTLMNSEMVSDRSIAFALMLEKQTEDVKKQLNRAFVRAFGRLPNNRERESLLGYYQNMVTHHEKTKPLPVEYPTRITRSLVEELSGRAFEYEEVLPVFEDYVADRKPWEVAPTTRALADICLLLINSNEFMFVY
jgi:hypothetical protein